MKLNSKEISNDKEGTERLGQLVDLKRMLSSTISTIGVIVINYHRLLGI